MKTWIVSSLDEETIQGEENIQGRKLYEEIRYVPFLFSKDKKPNSFIISKMWGFYYIIALGEQFWTQM